MLVERTQIAGPESYLRDGTVIDLAAGGATRRGTSQPLFDGLGLDVASLHLQLEADDIETLFARQHVPLLRVILHQRLTPDLIHTPFEHRRHTIGGAEDFRRGRMRNLEPLDVNGVQTLVSLDGETSCGWLSPRYRMPKADGVEITAAAWSLAASTLVALGAFTYSLRVGAWAANGDTATVDLCTDSSPRDRRALDAFTLAAGQDSVRGVAAYQIEFSAEVVHDAEFAEREAGAANSRTRGRPLLTAVHLLERVASPYDFHSLRELTAAASSWQLIQRPGEPARRLVCTLPLPARLGKGESVEIEVAGGHFASAEARLDATRTVRPPIIDGA